MTKDTEEILLLLCKAYGGRRKSQPEETSKLFSSSDTAEILKEFDPVARRKALAELRDEGYIKLYMRNSCTLLPRAIAYGMR